jgi:hypothetical protein
MGEDVTDGGLIDVSRLGMSELLTKADESSLARALNRILASDKDDAYNSFNSNI